MFWRLPFEGAAESWPPMAPAAHDDFPELRARFEDLDATVVPAFTAHDRAALMAQRHHRCYQLALIVGAALTGFAGALQAAINDTAWSGVAVTVLGLATTAIAAQQHRSRPMSTYLIERAKAEELRSLYFRYLSGTTTSDIQDLEAEVATIGHPKEAS
jgi:hypothetical protein